MGRRKSKGRYALPEMGRSVNRRPARVADAIRNEVAMLLLREMKDPRVANVSITDVKVTDDLRSAIVYFSCGDDDVARAEEGLNSARGFVRSSLAKSLTLRYMPKLVFEYDLSVSRHQEMDRIFKEIEDERSRSSQGDHRGH